MKKAMSILLALMLLLTLAGCGTAEAEPTAGSIAESTETTAEATTEAAEFSEAEIRQLCEDGWTALDSGDTAAAKDAFEAALSIDEGCVDAWLGLTELRIREYDFEGAEALLTEALEKTGNDPTIAEKIEMLHSDPIEDSSGKVLRMNGFNEDGDLSGYILYTYLPEGKLESVTSYDGSGDQTGYVLMEYDDQGRVVVGYVMIGDERTVGRIEYIRDEAGNEVERHHYSPEGSLQISFISEYNGQGQKIREEIHHDGTMVSYTLYSYGANGWLDREDRYSGNGKLDTYLTYTYDEAGREIGYCWYYGDGTLFERREYTRGEDGKILKEAYYDGEGNLTWVYEYE